MREEKLQTSLHDGTWLGKYLFWYWDDQSVLKHLFKVYVSGIIGGCLFFFLGMPLIIFGHWYLHSTLWTVVGSVVFLLQIAFYTIQPLIIYDMIELFGSIVHGLLNLVLWSSFTYIMYYWLSAA